MVEQSPGSLFWSSAGGLAEPSIGALASVLAAIGGAIGAGTEADAVYALILGRAASLLPYDEAAITLLRDGQPLAGPSVGRLLGPTRLGALLLRHWREETPRDIKAYQDEPLCAQVLEGAGVRDILSLPLLLEGGVSGWLTFASRLPAQYGELQRHVATLLAERAAHVAHLADLDAAHLVVRAELARLETLRQDFSATISHELRTPLTGIVGYLELLSSRWDSLDESRRRTMLARAQIATGRLDHLITDLLIVSNVEHHDLKIGHGVYQLATLVDHAVASMRAKYRGQRIDVHPSRIRALVRVDAERTIQVVTNVLDNAIKYSPEGRPVRIRLRCRPESVTIAVRDFGPGIREADLPRLFTRYGTIGHQPRSGQLGSGIGLYVCKKLVEGMHGRIGLISRPGSGSIFLISLPRAAEELVPVRMRG